MSIADLALRLSAPISGDFMGWQFRWHPLRACLVAGLACVSLTATASAAELTRTSKFTYYANGLLKQETVEPGSGQLALRTVHEYDAAGFGNEVKTTVGDSGATGTAVIADRISTATYDARGRFVVEAKNALNHTETREYDPGHGGMTRLTDANGQVTTWEYDAFGRKIKEVHGDPTASPPTGDGTQFTWSYLLCADTSCISGAVVRISRRTYAADGTTEIGAIQTTYYDALMRELHASTLNLSNTGVRVSTQYDGLGRVRRKSRPFAPSTETAQWTTYTYDVLGRVTLEERPDGGKTQIAYAVQGSGRKTTTTLNPGVTTPAWAEQKRTEIYNSQDQLIQVTDALNKSVAFTYDPFGNLLTSTDSAGNVISNTYDLRGRKTQTVDPDMGAWVYEYDVADQLKKQTDAKGQVTTFAYDKLGRLTNRTEPGLTSTWTWDTAANGKGKLASTTTNAGYTRTHTYDSLSRPSTTGVSIGGAAIGTFTSSYGTSGNATGRLEIVTYPSGFQAKYFYNARGYLSEIRDHAANKTIWRPVTANAGGQLTEFLTGYNSGTTKYNVTTRQTFDQQTGRLLTVQAGPASDPDAVQKQSFTYDILGNLVGRTDDLGTPVPLVETFTYDKLNRVLDGVLNGTTRSTAYNSIGNITSKTGSGNFSYNTGDPNPPAGVRPHAVRKVGSVLLTYDDNGNLTRQDGSSIDLDLTWTSFNMPTQILRNGTKSLNFTYDSDHNRLTQVSNFGGGTTTTSYVRDPASGIGVEKVTDGTVTTWRNYVYAGGQMVALRTESSTSGTSFRYIHKDHIGSSAAISGENGALVERYSYDVWGKRRKPDTGGGDSPYQETVPASLDRGFTEHEHLAEVALIHMNGRLYNQQTGRFISPDPFIQDPSDLQSLNRYSYVMNRPLTLTDPTGYFSVGDIGRGVLSGLRFVIRNSGTIIQITAASFGPVGGPIAGATVAAFQTANRGGSIGDAIKAGAVSYITAQAFSAVGTATGGHGVGMWYMSTPMYPVNVAGHALVGCASSVAQGGKCGPGALSAGLSGAAGPMLNNVSMESGTAISAVLGGIGSSIGGGKFANGALTGAYGYLFNFMTKREMTRSPIDLEGGGAGSAPWVGIFGALSAIIDRFFPENTIRIYRVYGGSAAWDGRSWGPEDPSQMADWRDRLAVYPVWNTGTHYVTGEVTVNDFRNGNIRPSSNPGSIAGPQPYDPVRGGGPYKGGGVELIIDNVGVVVRNPQFRTMPK